MADEPDGMDEALEGALRIGLTAAGRMGEVIARQREQSQRAAQAGDEHQARELQGRITADRATCRAQLAGTVDRDDWWATATPDQINHAWLDATRLRDIDPEINRAAEHMGDELRSRHGIDVRDLPTGEHALRDQLDRTNGPASTVVSREAVARDRVEAAMLVSDAGAVSPDDPPQPGRDRDRPEAVYDSAERREDLGSDFQGVDREGGEARVLADTHQARPAREAVATQPQQAPKARSARGSGGRTPERVRGR